MGHERVGLLPKTKNWREIVDALSASRLSETDLGDIARRTLANVRDRYGQIMFDKGVKAAFQFLVYLAVSSRMKDPSAELNKLGIKISDNPFPLALTKAVHNWVNQNKNSLEYAQIAQCAAGDVIAIWHTNHRSAQEELFDLPDDPYEIWRPIGKGAGFCELSRLFFAKFTERYLNYFLEREASAASTSIDNRNQITHGIQRHIDQISQHAFETSKITQSFAAGWFNKNARDGIPDDKAIDRFLVYAFEKMREELLREEQVI